MNNGAPHGGHSSSSRTEPIRPVEPGTSSWWHRRHESSPTQDLIKGLSTVQFGNQIILFGASLLLSVLPLIILLSALASSRVDDDISTRLGLDREGAHAVDTLFTESHVAFSLGVLVPSCSRWRGRWQLRAVFKPSTSESSSSRSLGDGRTSYGAPSGWW